MGAVWLGVILKKATGVAVMPAGVDITAHCKCARGANPRRRRPPRRGAAELYGSGFGFQGPRGVLTDFLDCRVLAGRASVKNTHPPECPKTIWRWHQVRRKRFWFFCKNIRYSKKLCSVIVHRLVRLSVFVCLRISAGRSCL